MATKIQQKLAQILALLLYTALRVSEQSVQQSSDGPSEPSQQEEIIMTIVVEPYKIECLFQTIANPKHKFFEIDYQVVEGGENDITFILKSPNGVVIAHDVKRSDGTHKITIDEAQNGRGDYIFCFDNSFSYTSKKRVFFEIFLLDKDGNYLSDYDVKALAKEQKFGVEFQLDAFNRITNKVKGNLNEVERMQSQFRAIEARDRATMEATYERVNFWSIVHLVCFLLAAGTQVYMLRSLFLDDSKVGRFIRRGKLH